MPGALTRVTAEQLAPPPGRVIGSGAAGWLIGHESNNGFILTNRLLKAGVAVRGLAGEQRSEGELRREEYEKGEQRRGEERTRNVPGTVASASPPDRHRSSLTRCVFRRHIIADRSNHAQAVSALSRWAKLVNIAKQ